MSKKINDQNRPRKKWGIIQPVDHALYSFDTREHILRVVRIF